MKEIIKKEMPNVKKYSIFLPDMDYIYFDNHRDFPFEPENRELSITNAWWLAEAAFLVYAHPGFARMAFKLAGLDNFRFFQGTGTECMVTWNNKFTIITFRGTELNSPSTLYEIVTDLNAIPTEFEKGGKVHKGFLKGLEEIWGSENGLKELIDSLIKQDPARPIWITGHSLGGALAALCFSRIESATGLYIFGSPRIGDKDFVEITKDKPIWRVEHDKDPIPLVPPNLPALKFCFEDIGNLIYIDAAGNITDKRPEMSFNDHKQMIKNTMSNQKSRDKTLVTTLKNARFNIQTGNNMYKKMNENIKQSITEWKGHMKQFSDDTAINFLDHMPIYYSSKLWNYIGSEL